jgi:hypothetical protein
MAEGTSEPTVAQRLGQLLDRGLLPAGGPAEAAERLIDRLERPARVALLGLPGSGKSAILNLLAGAVVVPETLRLPTIIVQHGTEPRMICTLTDGRTKALPGTDLADVLTLAPALVTVELDLPALKVIHLLEISAGPMEAEQRRAANWAGKRADIIIWCTTSYLPKEQLIWDSMPDVVKDNGFLFLTKTDLLGSRDAAAGMLDRVEQRAGEDFRHVLAISAKQARAAVAPDGTIDRAMFRDSGAAAVISTIKSRVQAAHRADTDTAELLLARHVEASSIVAKRFADPNTNSPLDVPAADDWVPPPDVAAPNPAESGPVLAEPDSPDVPQTVEPEVAEPPPPQERSLKPDAAPVERAILSAAAAAGPATLDLKLSEVEVDDPKPGPSLPEPEPVAAAELEPEPLASAVDPVAPDPAPAAEPEPLPESEPTPVASSRGFTAAPEGKRLTDRIRQATGPEDTSQPLVPLKSTWKSRAETEAARGAKPDTGAAEPAGQQAGSGLAQESPPEPTDADMSGDSGAGDEAVRPQVVAGRPQRETGRPRPGVPPRPPPQPLSKSPFGSRQALAEPPADLSSLRSALTAPRETVENDTVEETPEDAEVEATAAEVTETAAAVTPDPVLEDTPEDAPEETDEEPAPPIAVVPPPSPPHPPRAEVISRRPVVAMVAPASTGLASTPVVSPSPRVAVLRDRRPDPAPAESPVRRERPRVMTRPVSVPTSAPVPVPVSERGVLDRAIAIVIDRSAALSEMVDPDEKVPVDMILDHARETIDQVLAVISGGTSSEMSRINADFHEALDLVLLMQLEKGHAPADDALTVILQLRRDLETLLAA